MKTLVGLPSQTEKPSTYNIEKNVSRHWQALCPWMLLSTNPHGIDQKQNDSEPSTHTKYTETVDHSY